MRAPWSETVVQLLNEYQRLKEPYPYTCPDKHKLRAKTNGWICPHKGCEYTQDWAHPLSIQIATTFKEK